MRVRRQLERRVRALIADPGTRKDAVRDLLIGEIAAWQSARIPEYGRLHRDGAWPPALPTDVFRVRRIASHPLKEDARVFRSSGTTSSNRSAHVFKDLGLYDAAARAAAKYMLFPDVERMRLVFLAPHEEEAPHSSLSYMLTRFAQWFGSEHTWVWHDGGLDIERLETTLVQAVADGQAVALLGTSFAFVHAEDGLGDSSIPLPVGSRIMQTGGYKGRSREVRPAELRRAMSRRYGVPEPWIVAEYGMTELSSQMYETTLRDDLTGISSPRRLWIPPWVRATPVDPDTLQPVQGDACGVLRIDDCASLDSVCCIQSADLATRVEDGIVVEGRAPGAAPRGCSLAADEALGVS
ncbi:MAG: acyl-protein synthetase [Myxococcales bacterium]|nr:acyl-protein synthetase [Myxococcales bacterium]MDH3482781.1 acyl-protein synthetase [Myxococcales bacterium]